MRVKYVLERFELPKFTLKRDISNTYTSNAYSDYGENAMPIVRRQRRANTHERNKRTFGNPSCRRQFAGINGVRHKSRSSAHTNQTTSSLTERVPAVLHMCACTLPRRRMRTVRMDGSVTMQRPTHIFLSPTTKPPYGTESRRCVCV